MAWPKGKPRPEGAGRRKGTPNKSTQTIKDRLAEMGCDYLEYLALTVMNKIPCAVCRGAGKTKFQPRGGQTFSGVRTCQSCWGSGMERIEPRQSAWAAAELMSYCEPKRKAIEITGAEGGPVDNVMRVVFVEAKDGKPAN